MRSTSWIFILLAVLLPGFAASALAASVVVSPTGVTLIHGQSQQFHATDSGGLPVTVVWGISPTVGSISSSGLYVAPASIFAGTPSPITVTATPVNSALTPGTATVTLQPTVAIGVSPASATLTAGQSQKFTATVTGTTNTAVTWSASPNGVGSMGSDGTYTAPATISAKQTVTVTAVSVADPTQSGSATVTLQATAQISVTVSPQTITLSNNEATTFSATVTNSSNQNVTWSISPQLGTILSTGSYVAPAAISGKQTVTVTATSVADASKSGTATVTLSTTIDVGSGAPTAAIQQAFITAYYAGFSSLVSLPPLGNVKRLGTGGLVQEFSDLNKTAGVKLALVSNAIAVPASGIFNVFQVWADIYSYYGTVGAATAGYPTMSTAQCPMFDPANSCTYQFFDKGYALFSYLNAIQGGQDFTIRLSFYTKWAAAGGLSGYGRPEEAEATITASTATTATVQAFSNGAIYTVTSGTNKNLLFGVMQPIYGLYLTNGGPSGSLGLPVGDEVVLASGVHTQKFESGASLQYTVGSDPGVKLPVAAVALSGAAGSSSVSMKLGDTLTLSATALNSTGQSLAGRVFSWSTTNSRVVTIQASADSAVLTAVGGGSASVTAASEGVVSPRFNVIVTAPCCQIGDGAPAAVQQAFQDALGRNRLAVRVPSPSPAVRSGSGYTQTLQSADSSSSAVYLMAKSDRSGTAYVVAGDLLKRYQELGGPAGQLGYPLSDASAGGRQPFENATLSGSPVRIVAGGVLSKWAVMGYETGAAGDVASDPTAFQTFGANSGAAQTFRNGVIFSASAGPRAGQSYFSSGLILSRYLALGGPSGSFGMPVGDEVATGVSHQQSFEGGSIGFNAGDSAAQERAAPKAPAVAAAPATVLAGGRARLAVSGFPDGATLRVSVSGQPDFLVTTTNGAYGWDLFVPLSAKSGSLAIHAADTRSAATADGALTVKGFADNRTPLAKVQGDNQTGMPGALLPQSLRVQLRDSSGSPVVGAPVVFQASPGAKASPATAFTDALGQAETFVRLPASEGVTLVTADSPSIATGPLTFGARAVSSSLANFPQTLQAGAAPLGSGPATIAQKGALVTAAASILRYHQNRGDVASPNGPADPAALNQFLKTVCATDSSGAPLCDGFLSNPDSGEQVVNLWRATDFTGGLDPSVEQPDLARVADLVAQGTPVLLSLSLTLNGSPAGGHFVVAIGVGPDGSLRIADPNPLLARGSLADYLNGFQAGPGIWKAELRGAVRFVMQSPSATRFLLAALSQPADLFQKMRLDVRSSAGACGAALELQDSVDAAGAAPARGPLVSRLLVCDGLQPVYQVTAGAPQPYRLSLTDMASGGSSRDLSGAATATYKVTRPQLTLAIAPQDIGFTAEGVVNAASFTRGVAPGGALSIFGSGLAGDGATTVELDGVAVQVLAATPFQVNGVVPLSTVPGSHVLRVRSAFGSAQQTVEISAAAPAIFMVGTPPAGAVQNQDWTLNAPGNPLPRGQTLIVYATGLGAVVQKGAYSEAATPVTVVLNGMEFVPAFAGLTPGFSGLYQVNVPVPASAPPGLGLALTLKQGGAVSNSVSVAVQ